MPLTDAQAAALAERTIHFCMPYMHESEADKGTARSSGGVGGPGALGSTAHRPQAHDAFTALGFANAVWALGALGVTRSVSFTAVAAAAAPQPEDDSTADVDPRHSAGGSVDGDSAQSSCTAGAVAGVHATRAGDKAPAPGQSSDLEGAAPCTPPLDAAVRGDPEHVAEPIGWGVTEGATAGGPANEAEAQLAPLLAASRRLLPTCSVPELVSSCTGLSKLGVRSCRFLLLAMHERKGVNVCMRDDIAGGALLRCPCAPAAPRKGVYFPQGCLLPATCTA